MSIAALQRRRTRALADIRGLVAALGGDSVVQGVYDCRFGLSGAAWSDPRTGVEAGPALALAGGVAIGSAGVVFDGLSGFARNSVAGRLAELTGSAAVVTVQTLPPSSASDQFMAALTVSAASTLMSVRRTFSSTTLTAAISGGNTSAFDMTGLAGVRVVVGNRIQSGGNATTGIRVGSAAEVTSAAAATAGITAGRLTIAAGSPDVASGFASMTCRAVLVLAGLTTAQENLINAWAAGIHGATL